MEEERFGQNVQGLCWNNVLLPLHLQASGRFFWKCLYTIWVIPNCPSRACTTYSLVPFTIRPPYAARCQIFSPWLHGGDLVDSGIGFSCRPASLCSLAGRYDNPVPESTISPVRVSEFNLWSELGTGWPSWPVILYCRSTTYMYTIRYLRYSSYWKHS